MVDGDNGMGHLVMSRAAETAAELAKETGVAWVGAKRSNHAGAAGVYAAMPLAQDMVGIYAVVANANHMPVWGSSENLLGTNPVAFAIPAGEEPPVVLDIATTVVSYGTVKANKLQGKPMPAGWMIDKQGQPLTDSAKSAEGLLMPIGGHKGSGLALVLGLLAGTMNGAAFGRDVVDFNYDNETACDTGHFIVALDVSRFMPMPMFKAAVDRHLRDLKSSPKLPGVDAIRLPGEQRLKRRAERARDGVPVYPEVIAQLDALAGELKVKPLTRALTLLHLVSRPYARNHVGRRLRHLLQHLGEFFAVHRIDLQLELVRLGEELRDPSWWRRTRAASRRRAPPARSAA